MLFYYSILFIAAFSLSPLAKCSFYLILFESDLESTLVLYTSYPTCTESAISLRRLEVSGWTMLCNGPWWLNYLLIPTLQHFSGSVNFPSVPLFFPVLSPQFLQLSQKLFRPWLGVNLKQRNKKQQQKARQKARE